MKVWLLTIACCVAAVAHAQVIGTVPIADAAVTTGTGQSFPVSAGRATLTGSTTVTAKDHTAEVALARGGEVRVCRTTGLHVAASRDAMVLGLDRGAMEIHTKAAGGDVVMTPDLRVTMPGGGALDLRMRVSPDGDTCVENRGRKAPTLMITDAFGEANYLIKPGQHVMFERGSLRAVVDHETTPCGCPPDEVRAVPLAEALLHGGASTVSPQQAAAANPFPEAISAGLAPARTPTPPPVGVPQTQVATTIVFDPEKDAAAAKAATPPVVVAPPAAAPVAPPAPAKGGGPFRAMGRFFKRLFVR